MKASDFHLPIICITDTGTLLAAAAVAAPMRKLCPLYSFGSKLLKAKDNFRQLEKYECVTGDPHGKQKRGPVLCCAILQYSSNALTGQYLFNESLGIYIVFG